MAFCVAFDLIFFVSVPIVVSKSALFGGEQYNHWNNRSLVLSISWMHNGSWLLFLFYFVRVPCIYFTCSENTITLVFWEILPLLLTIAPITSIHHNTAQDERQRAEHKQKSFQKQKQPLATPHMNLFRFWGVSYASVCITTPLRLSRTSAHNVMPVFQLHLWRYRTIFNTKTLETRHQIKNSSDWVARTTLL